MSFIRLNSFTSRLVCNNLLRGFIGSSNRRALQTDRIPPTKAKDSEVDTEDNEPIRYSTSPAAAWRAEYSQTGGKDETPWFQPLVVGGSTAIFMIYFFILRESNDIDQIFDLELGDHFEHINADALKRSANVPITDQRFNNSK